tara:strand:- start:1255 stop:1395 length:141 start_codon:yes stop_codon:yes gene_type:complete
MSIFYNDFDDALTNLIQKGLVEIVGINEKGELMYQLAEDVKIPKQK